MKADEASAETDVAAEKAPQATPVEAEAEKSDIGSMERIELKDVNDCQAPPAAPSEAALANKPQTTANTVKSVSSDEAKVIDNSKMLDVGLEPAGKNSADNEGEADEPAKNSILKSSVTTRPSVGGKQQSPPKPDAQTKLTRPVKSSMLGSKHKGSPLVSRISKATELRRQREEERRNRELARKAALEKEENDRIAEQRAYQKELEKESREDERKRRLEDRKDADAIRQEKRDYEKERRKEIRAKIDAAANDKATSLTLADLDKIRAQNQFLDRFNGMADDDQKISFDATAPRGPSQTVIYTSRFVDKLSDVTDDMSVSGSLSIKAAKVGGSGRGSFVDSDKFKESDLNFYISVKVINQTLNFKDALVFNPLRSVDPNNFQQVYGDSFISGFLEGGEFNALVSMKIMNKAKMTDIKAEAKVAFTAGPIDVTAEANVGIARSNIETNTETTIQVSWCGGGHIKPMEQQWDIKSLMQAAARFADLVADCPQRTYAILTKYDTLRSFVARKPASYTPLQYENAQIYTNALMDSFMTYKALYKQLGDQTSPFKVKLWSLSRGHQTTTL